MPKDWKIEFDQEFPNSRNIFEGGDPYDGRRNAIKLFIENLLSEAKREEMVKLLEEMPKEKALIHNDRCPCDDITGDTYNGAISQVAEIIKKRIR